MKIIDKHGQEQDAAWLAKHYGPVFVQGQSDKYRVAELREVESPTLFVTVPAKVKTECFYFGYEFGYKGIWGRLLGYPNSEGVVTFPLPPRFTYKLAGQGTHWLNVDGLRLIGLGVPEGAPGWRHLDVVFEEAT